MDGATRTQIDDPEAVGGRVQDAPIPLDQSIGSRAIWLVPAAAVLVAGLVWTNLSSTVGSLIALHAACMLAAWGILLPAGGLLARFAKVPAAEDFPREVENLYWWIWHRRLQYAGISVATFGFVVILVHIGPSFDTVHTAGSAWPSCCWVGRRWARPGCVARRWTNRQAGRSRRSGNRAGDHCDMTVRQRLFEAWHKSASWAALGAGLVTIVLGVELVGTPPWLFVIVAAVGGAVIAGFLHGTFRRNHTGSF